MTDLAEAVIARVGEASRATVERIDGHVWPRLHRAVIAALPPLVGAAFGGAFDERVTVTGPLAELRALAHTTTLVFAPTHASNTDALVLGLALARAGLPAPCYAAGRHIYRNRVIGALIRRLGAYQLDPDRRDRRYLHVVYEYTAELARRGTHLVIFPGGTRSRTHAVETARSLKLGLLGAVVHAARTSGQPLAVVPVTIDYQVVPEAPWLIGYHLAGRAHERIVGDELFAWSRLAATARLLWRLDQRVAIRFGAPIAPVSRAHLVTELAVAYRRQTTLFPTHLTARTLHALGRIAPAQAVHAAVGEPVARAALAAWASCHDPAPVIRDGDHYVTIDPALVLFYQNRAG